MNEQYEKASPSTKKERVPPYVQVVDQMTSKDFCGDPRAHLGTVRYLLEDKARFDVYKQVILSNRHIFRGRTVLNVACDVGLLALFAAKAGAAHVYAVDDSNVVDYLHRIASANGFGNIIHVIKGRIDKVKLPTKNVDVIVSDWMGYSLLYNSKCKEVIYARDKWLKRGGSIFPDLATLHLTAVQGSCTKNIIIDFWDKVQDFNMKCIKKRALSEPVNQILKPNQILGRDFIVKTLNMYTATNKDLSIQSMFELKINKSGMMDGVATYFVVYFSRAHTPQSLSTEPWAAKTNWGQMMYYFDEAIVANEGERFFGGFKMNSVEKRGSLLNMEVHMEMYRGKAAVMDFQLAAKWVLRSRTLYASAIESEAEPVKSSKTSAVAESFKKLKLNG